MNSISYALITILFFLLVLIYKLSRNIKEERKKNQEIIESQQAAINALEQERNSAQDQITSYYLKISRLNDSLNEIQRELDFYKNIRDASGNLNEPDSSPPSDSIQLDPEQSALCEEMENSHNHFFVTGKAGTGKSFLLNTFRKNTRKSHLVLAPTGLAAINVNGATLHSAFGYPNLVYLNINEISSETVRLSSEKRLVLKHISTIIIDEISMVRADTFDKIDRILKVINENSLPFGGKQMILFGDLFQLPPIVENKNVWELLFDRYGGEYFFCSDAYKQSNFQLRELTINHRQSEDAEYFELLNRVRNGTTTPNDISTLNSKLVIESSIYDRFTMLLPKKSEVEYINRKRISQLNSEEYTYHAAITYSRFPDKKPILDNLFPMSEPLCLKKGVLVMMVTNDPARRWVNGTLGIVDTLSDSSIFVAIDKNIYEIHPCEFSQQEVTYKNGKLLYETILTVMQYPIVPAYAITIHKSQGQTYKNIICDINKCFADGQAYVALSRCSSFNGLHLAQPISQSSLRVNRSVLDFYQSNFPGNTQLNISKL